MSSQLDVRFPACKPRFIWNPTVSQPTIYWKPSRPDDEVLGSAGVTASDAVGLLIHLQGLGLRVRPHHPCQAFD